MSYLLMIYLKTGLWFIAHCILNRLSHTIYWKSPISIFGYVWLWDLHIPREKWLNYLQTVETLIRGCVLQHLIWVCTVCQLPFYGSPNYNGLRIGEAITWGNFSLSPENKLPVNSNFASCASYRNNPKYQDGQAWANRIDQDQIPQIVSSDQGLHCLPIIQQLLRHTNR